jgi:predicted nucleic acid-binding protein
VNDTLCYLDTSAFVKLVVDERESEALREFLIEWPQRFSSVLLDVEAHRLAQRTNRATTVRTDRLLRSLSLVPVSPEVRSVARSLPPPTLRALDSIHLASALTMGSDLGVFVAYDHRLLDAAADAGLPVASPS